MNNYSMNNYISDISLDKIDKFLDIHKLPKLTQEKIENLDIKSKEIELVIKISQQRKAQEEKSSLVNSINQLKKN